MSSSIEDVACYTFSNGEKVFLDTNIWFFLYGPRRTTKGTRVAAYSQVFARLLAANCPIHIDALVLSEFINAYARLKWNIAGKPLQDFKKFRQSAGFKPIAQDIAADARKVLTHCDRVESGFESVDIMAIVTEFESGGSDFNDQMLAAICKQHGFKFLTDDADFGGQGIPILTANKRLLP